MAKFSCFSILVGRKNKNKEEKKSTYLVHEKGLGALQVKLEHPTKGYDTDELNSTSFCVSIPYKIHGDSSCKVKILSEEIPVEGSEAVEEAYEGEDEHDENSSIKREFSDFDLQAQERDGSHELNQSKNTKIDSSELMGNEINHKSKNPFDREANVGVELNQSGHISDPGIEKAPFWASPKLKRSCSNLETRDMLREIADQISTSRSHSFEDLQNLSEKVREEIIPGIQGSPASIMTPGSADRVMLKKRSYSQILPSRSRRLWWKLFLWSHRNPEKPRILKQKPLFKIQSPNQKGGYSSDTLEPNRVTEFSKLESPDSFTREAININSQNKKNALNWATFQNGASGLWPQNQWVALYTESSSLTRVDEWVNNLEIEPSLQVNGDEGIEFPPSPENGRSPARNTVHMNRGSNDNLSEEVLHANNLIQSLNTSSTIAHISGMGLKIIPNISRFSSLKSVNLSGNFIVHITPSSLPKGIHTLNLSRNKISAIEGLREITRLRVLDLSYNRISRIGHGLSNCTLIKELYLGGNKISDVEGLHRLLKLSVLDLSFNKISTTKALGQLVANYNSLQAVNLLGNPIQNNIGDDQLKKTVSSLLPQITYLNKQPIKSQRAREVAMDSVAKAALGNNGWASRRKPASRRVGKGSSVSSSAQKGKRRSARMSSNLASSSR